MRFGIILMGGLLIVLFAGLFGYRLGVSSVDQYIDVPPLAQRMMESTPNDNCSLVVNIDRQITWIDCGIGLDIGQAVETSLLCRNNSLTHGSLQTQGVSDGEYQLADFDRFFIFKY